MKFIHTLSALAFAGLSLSYPIQIRSNAVSSLVGSSSTTGASGASDTIPAAAVDTDTENHPNTVLEDVKTDATAKAATSSSTSGNTKASSKTPTAAQVKTAAANFATDANTVSANINTMADAQSASQLKSMATTAFKAETDEVCSVLDSWQQELVLTCGRMHNGRYLQQQREAQGRSPTLWLWRTRLQSWQAWRLSCKILLLRLRKRTWRLFKLRGKITHTFTLMQTKDCVADIVERNPNILPSITQLSNTAMQAVGLPQTAQKFPATTG